MMGLHKQLLHITWPSFIDSIPFINSIQTPIPLLTEVRRMSILIGMDKYRIIRMKFIAVKRPLFVGEPSHEEGVMVWAGREEMAAAGRNKYLPNVGEGISWRRLTYWMPTKKEAILRLIVNRMGGMHDR